VGCALWLALSYIPMIVALGLLAVGAWALDGSDLVITLLVGWVGGNVYMALNRRSGRLRFIGVCVTEQAEPELWQLVHETVELPARTRIDGLWLTSGANAGALVGHRDWLLRRHVGLVVGYFLVIWLDRESLRVVLAHEAGHLADRNVLRLRLARRRSRIRPRLTSRWHLPVRWYWRWWMAVTRESAIDAERHADRVSAELTGQTEVERVLGEVMVAHAINQNASESLEQLWNQGVAPKRIVPFYRVVLRRLDSAAISRLARAITEETDQIDDSHPGAVERGATLPASVPKDLPTRGILRHPDYYDVATTALHTRLRSRHVLNSADIEIADA
jgi:hypothetical protein